MRLANGAVLVAGLSLCVAQTPAQLRPESVPARRSDDPARSAPAPAKPTLFVGDRVPALRIEKWIKGVAVPKLEPGKVYIVEFWASWCAPCGKCLPRLSELQSRFRDRGLTVIGVSSQETSPAELSRFVAAQGDRLAYSVALDDNGASADAWMIAAGQGSIPTAFLIDQQSRIAWIGHPLDGLEDATVRVLDGTFDLAAAAAAHRRRIDLLAAAQPTLNRFRAAADEGDHPTAIALAEELVALDAREFGQYALVKFQIMAWGQRDYAGAYKHADQAVAGPLKDNAEILTALASTICDDVRLERRDFAIAKRAATRANELTGGKRPDILAILARSCAETGDLPGAIELQTKVVELSTDQAAKTESQRRLADYRARAQQLNKK